MIFPVSHAITGPGWYSMSAAQYHADPCPLPSLSASIAKKLLRSTPRHAAAAHPRLSGDAPSVPTSSMLFGSAVHTLVLGQGARITVLEHSDYRTKAAQDARDAAFLAGKLPILARDFDRADMVADAVRARCRIVDPEIFSGQSELVAIWKEGEVWCRAMIDSIRVSLPKKGIRIAVDDLKTSGNDISPSGVGRTIANFGYELQAAFYERGIRALMGKDVDEFSFNFCFVETEPPYEATIARIDGAGRELGRREVCAALEVWRRCQAAGVWPGYPTSIITAELPPWHVASWELREQDDPMLQGISY